VVLVDCKEWKEKENFVSRLVLVEFVVKKDATLLTCKLLCLIIHLTNFIQMNFEKHFFIKVLIYFTRGHLFIQKGDKESVDSDLA
jgi:hypothetical protein